MQCSSWTMERILRSLNTTVFCVCPGHLCCQTFFSESTKLLILDTSATPAALFDGFLGGYVFPASLACIEDTFDQVLWFHSYIFPMQMPPLESFTNLLPALTSAVYMGFTSIALHVKFKIVEKKNRKLKLLQM